MLLHDQRRQRMSLRSGQLRTYAGLIRVDEALPLRKVLPVYRWMINLSYEVAYQLIEFGRVFKKHKVTSTLC